jgi:hypothetical protein
MAIRAAGATRSRPRLHQLEGQERRRRESVRALGHSDQARPGDHRHVPLQIRPLPIH